MREQALRPWHRDSQGVVASLSREEGKRLVQAAFAGFGRLDEKFDRYT